MTVAVIVDYEPSWPQRARHRLDAVKAALSPLAESDRFDYERIGSTSVPGLAAKPIIDLQVRMPYLPALDQLADLLAGTGFISCTGGSAGLAGRLPGHPAAGRLDRCFAVREAPLP